MFTGLVQEIGTVAAAERSDAGASLTVEAELATRLEPGDSVSVAGACLTVANRNGSGFRADVMNQTLELTTLGGLAAGSRVNLEPALRAGDPLGGHIVQGHVDCRGAVVDVREDGFARRVEVELPPEAGRFVADRGSVALDGVSLTVAEVSDARLAVALIPETLERTTLGDLRQGGLVNVELDLIARYLDRLMQRFEEEGR